MIHLSKLILNPRNPGARRDAAVPYEMHRTLLRGFGPVAPDGNRLLFRVDHSRYSDEVGIPVIVQSSPYPVDWTFLKSMGDYAMAVEQKEVRIKLNSGMVAAFRLAANPTVKRGGKRQPLLREEDQLQWLERKAAVAGFSVLHVVCSPYRTRSPRRQGSSYDKSDIPHFGVRFDGILQVSDPLRLVENIKAGIGPAKGFGFGLLSLGAAV